MTNINNSSGQRGVALLFALGILSLLLVMGVAFLGNALISQKIAVNSQESASAKMLARSAVDRVLAHLTVFHLAQIRSAGDFYAADGSSVFSRVSTAAFDETSKLSVARDRIYTGNAPMLSISRGKEGSVPWYDGSTSLAEWIYVHEDGKFSNGTAGGEKIVGRFAYQVLPQPSASRLSLYAVTAGASRRAGENRDSAATARVPQKHRLGLEVDELVIPNTMFSTYWKHDSTALCDPLHEFDNFINVLAGGKSGADHFRGNDALTESRRRWLEHIFAEGRGRVAREAFWGGDGWYPRFNLGKFNYYWDSSTGKRVPVRNSGDNNWYQRFLDLSTPPADAATETAKIADISNGKVSDGVSAVDRLLKAHTVSGKYTDACLYDGQYEVLGLPFLRRIGNFGEKGGFEKVEDLRRQIAANLNDYCDTDSIPTSDVAADTWKDKVDKIDDLPKFTGNEQTPYINELAFGFKMSDGKITAETGKCDFEAKFTPEIIAELIRVYKSTPGITGTQLHGFIKSLGVTLKVSVSGTATGSYKKSVDGVETTVTVPEFNLNDLLIEGSDISYSEFKNKKFEIPFDTGVGGPYWVKNFQFTDAADVISVKASLYQKLRELSGTTDNEVSFTVNPTKIKVEISKVSFNLGNLVLTATVDGKENVGIDFVRFINPPGDSETFSVTSEKAKEYTSMTDLSKDGIFHVGVMQAIDPRQNLNVVFQRNGTSVSTSLKSSDWLLSKDASLQFTADESAWKWDDFATRVTGGGVNSNPSAPKYADESSMTAQNNCDTEETQDPAWLGDDPKQHISTAAIRNAPMRSPWELGFIHRGIPFQTINLLKAGGIENNGDGTTQTVLAEDAHKPDNFTDLNNSLGTSYKNGDAGILDQVKMTDLTRAYGKVDFSALQNQPVNWITGGDSFDTLKTELFQSLFANLKTQQAYVFVDKVKELDKAPVFDAGTESPLTFEVIVNDFAQSPVTALRSRILAGNSNLIGKYELRTTNAAQEEIIGKTINLIEGRGASLPTVFKVVIAAQSIRDLDGVMTKLDKDGSPLSPYTASIGKFDAKIVDKDSKGSDLDSSVYYDEILGECRMLVTIEKLHYFDNDVPRARLRVKQIEYLD